MQEKFNRKTFEYFKDADKHYKDRDWFEINRPVYERNVKKPFENLVEKINLELRRDLKGIKISSRSISRPLRPANKAHDLGHVKNFISTNIAEKKTSIFEWNPTIHIQLGEGKDENLIGVGLYLVSGRQIKELRSAFYHRHKEIQKIINKKAFKDSWGEVKGEQYKRFPKDFEQGKPYSKYLWYKQFYVSKTFSKTAVMRKDFIDNAVKDLKVSLPFFNWVRDSVGTYKRSESLR